MDRPGAADGAEQPLLVHLPGGSEECLPWLRQSLATALAEGVRDVQVHADGHDVELPVLRALAALSEVLVVRGGGVQLVGAGERARQRCAVHGLTGLLAAVPEP